MDEKPNYYAIIPADVRYDSRLKPMEKLMFGEITALSNKYGYCTASNEYFCKIYEIKRKPTISDWVGNLKKYNYIKVVPVKNEKKQIVKRKIYINHSRLEEPVTEKRNTPYEKTYEPITKKRKENSTSINTTSKNNATTTADAQNPNSELKDNFTDVLTFYQQNIGVLNPITTEDIVYWCNDLSPEVVTEAIRRTAQSNKSWRYATAILRDWVKHNIKTLDQIKASDVEFQKKNEVKYSSYKKPKKEGKEDGARW